MTKQQAKKWLNRNYHFSRQLDADRRMLAILQNRLSSGVAKYESDGTESHDPDASRKRHEDTLAEFSMMREKVEREERLMIEETARTLKAINELTDPDHHAIATDRYISLLKWSDIATLENVSIAQVYRLHGAMLEKMADILQHFDF